LTVLSSKDGKVESQEDFESAGAKRIKLVSVQTGFGVMFGDKIVIKKLTSSGKVDETFKACQTVSTLVDVAYETKNPAQIIALTE